ncbi:aminomethyl-transferring glycine dehydrogenase [soil metagenome]
MTTIKKVYKFADRHIGPDENEINIMLKAIGFNSTDELINATIPSDILSNNDLKINDSPLHELYQRRQNTISASEHNNEAYSEYDFLKMIRNIASKNKVFKSHIGLGYNPTITPPVILRNILENPGWYTQYTPYQAEIAQGRLEALINFQSMVIDLTRMEIANASLLDEGTAAAEAMHLFYSQRPTNKKLANKFFVSIHCLPQTIEVLNTRALPLGIEIVMGDHRNFEMTGDIFGAIVQYPAADGDVFDYTNFFSDCDKLNIFKCVAADILSICMLKAPGEFGADIVVGSTQRFGVPMGYGGPHAAFFACREAFKRNLPGRIIGLTVDSNGNPAYRMALQTREQHIRREKATSNICTAQVLLAVIAGMYAVYHGSQGLRGIAEGVNTAAKRLDSALQHIGMEQVNKNYFDTLKIKIDKKESDKVRKIAEENKINFRYFEEKSESYIGISLNEYNIYEGIDELVNVFKEYKKKKDTGKYDSEYDSIPDDLKREKPFLVHPVFNTHQSETELLRYMKMLENKDLSLTTSMIPLGSCTMKLNATAEMIPVTFPEFAEIHPFAPFSQTEGYKEMIDDLEKDLCEITGFAGVSLQPNSGAQGEYAGLLVIKAYHESRDEGHRKICLIPASAHGTNPASAVMAGMTVVVVKFDEKGNIDVEDLKEKAELHKNNLSALMVTYPSTHGVYEKRIKEICNIIHTNGGQVYMDGANMNAQVGLTSPANINADVCHLNLHKTFCIPHGGGGPGIGPIGVASHLVEFLPGHSVVNIGNKNATTAVSAAPWGSAGILVISYAYIKMMGAAGLKKATEVAILNANYIKHRLSEHYKTLYTGENNTVAHEMIFDMREFKTTAGIEVIDIAKRLMDYGFHAPTVSFPVPGTVMIEPTESETLHELDRFCDALISIRKEISEIENAKADRINNVLKNSPHTALHVASDKWEHPYSREKAFYPTEDTRRHKFFPSVGRVNDAYGDRNLFCSCIPIGEYEHLEA